MADLDTRDKRSSGILISLPFRGRLPNVDSSVDQPDRQHVPFMYSGIAAGGAGPAPTGPPVGTLTMMGLGR